MGFSQQIEFICDIYDIINFVSKFIAKLQL
jgi:hypothetical protein